MRSAPNPLYEKGTGGEKNPIHLFGYVSSGPVDQGRLCNKLKVRCQPTRLVEYVMPHYLVRLCHVSRIIHQFRHVGSIFLESYQSREEEKVHVTTPLPTSHLLRSDPQGVEDTK